MIYLRENAYFLLQFGNNCDRVIIHVSEKEKRNEGNMNKTELIAAVTQSAGLTKKDTERVINAAIDAITASLTAGDKVQIPGFGTFEVKEREARIGRNPHTREAVEIPATKVPAFKPSKALKDTVAK